MPTDLYSAALIAIIVVIAGIVGIRSRISSAVLEAMAGILLGNFLGVKVEPWLDFLGTFGGLMLILLAGAEVDLALLVKNARQSFTLGFMAFIVPFIGEILFLYTFTSWSFLAKMVTSLALTSTAIAVIYAMFLEAELLETGSCKLIISAVFINNIITLICVNLISHEFNIFTLIFFFAIIVTALGLPKLLEYIVNHYSKRSNELELRFIFAVMLGISFLADVGQMQAIFGAFLFGLVSANSIRSYENILPKIRSITFSLLSPLFFIKAGLLVSLPAIMQSAILIFSLLGVKIITKSIGTYYYNKKWMPDAPIFSTILFSTGLTVGIVTAAFGRDFNFLDQSQFSIVTVTVILSAIIPAIIARRFIPIALKNNPQD